MLPAGGAPLFGIVVSLRHALPAQVLWVIAGIATLERSAGRILLSRITD